MDGEATCRRCGGWVATDGRASLGNPVGGREVADDLHCPACGGCPGETSAPTAADG